MTLTSKISEVNQALVDLLKESWNEIGANGPDDIYYGDQAKYPRFPSFAIEVGDRANTLYQTGLQTEVEFRAFIMIFHAPIANISSTKKERDELSESVEDIVHTDRRLGGLVVHGHITRIEPGIADRGGLMHTTRLTWEGQSRARIGA
jgi:hypothetical protein